jgi:[acyl-carrier-protein] S-malonyltransferase
VKGVEAVEAKAKSFKARMTVILFHHCRRRRRHHHHHLFTVNNHGSNFSQVRLAVAGAFHTSFMEPAVSRLEAALAATEIRQPRIPVISNVDAQPHADPATIKKILARQVNYS